MINFVNSEKEMETYSNPQLKLAYEFVQYTGRNIFLTGKAGTGKTTFLKNLKEHSHKRMIVVAPTGVAAINAKGVTIHSFFQLPFGPYIPNEKMLDQDNLSYRRFSKQKINIIKTIELLVIDEISMVRSDLLDGIDSTLRRFRINNKPFGGVQLLMIGDLQQLAPVVKDDERELLKEYYKTSFFFGSNALQKTNYISIELDHVFRQSDQKFINLLNKIRENKIDKSVIDQLNERYLPDNLSDIGYITLTTHNAKAREINESRLRSIDETEYRFMASITGIFQEYSYPNDFELVLKKGAQVMFVKNDPTPEKRYYNGKIGMITDISNNKIEVLCEGDEEPIEAQKLTWEKVKYSINESSGEIDEEIEGMFHQYPLKLAWAITIHKSQGLTFDNAIIDAESAFAHGQVYVALSRCRTIEGMILSSPINPNSVFSDIAIDRFTKNIEANQPGQEKLIEAKRDYFISVLMDLFDFLNLQKYVYFLIKILKSNFTSIPGNPLDEFTVASKIISEDVVLVARRFHSQLLNLTVEDTDPEKSNELQDRIKKGALYFLEKINLSLQKIVSEYEPETDNKAVKKVLKNALENVVVEYKTKVSLLESVKDGFILTDYLNKKALTLLVAEAKQKTSKRKNKTNISGNENPELYRILKAWRDEKSKEMNTEVYRVIQLKTMQEICHFLPSTPDELALMSGMGKKKMEAFSDEILEIIIDYRGEYNVSGEHIEVPEKKKKQDKKNTKQISLEMYQEGMNVKQIANERGFIERTIEGHLATFVGTGEISVTDFVDAKMVSRVINKMTNIESTLLSEIKEQLDEEISYAQLRFILEHMKYKKII